MGRKDDGFPGVKTLWRGLRRLVVTFVNFIVKKDVYKA
ncbi:MAG: hypothetical protein ACM65K_08515 [Microcoleus sp.]